MMFYSKRTNAGWNKIGIAYLSINPSAVHITPLRKTIREVNTDLKRTPFDPPKPGDTILVFRTTRGGSRLHHAYKWFGDGVGMSLPLNWKELERGKPMATLEKTKKKILAGEYESW